MRCARARLPGTLLHRCGLRHVRRPNLMCAARRCASRTQRASSRARHPLPVWRHVWCVGSAGRERTSWGTQHSAARHSTAVGARSSGSHSACLAAVRSGSARARLTPLHACVRLRRPHPTPHTHAHTNTHTRAHTHTHTHAAEEESTLNLQALQEACPNAPWSLTFSYGRALQATTLKVRRRLQRAACGAPVPALLLLTNARWRAVCRTTPPPPPAPPHTHTYTHAHAHTHTRTHTMSRLHPRSSHSRRPPPAHHARRRGRASRRTGTPRSPCCWRWPRPTARRSWGSTRARTQCLVSARARACVRVCVCACVCACVRELGGRGGVRQRAAVCARGLCARPWLL
jgi:hypothetical protein